MEDNESGITKNNNSSYNEVYNKYNSMSNQEGSSEISQNDSVREFKIILIGSSSVGKTSIFNKFLTGNFPLNVKSTINVEFKTKILKINNNLYAKLILWDTCGSEKYRAVTRLYYKGANGIILVFDLTNQKSFDELKSIWLRDIKNNTDQNVQIIIVGNKQDLIENRKVSESMAINFCKENGYKYIEASAKEGTNILKIFEEISFDLYKEYEKQKEEEANNRILMGNFDDKNLIIAKNKKFLCC